MTASWMGASACLIKMYTLIYSYHDGSGSPSLLALPRQAELRLSSWETRRTRAISCRERIRANAVTESLTSTTVELLRPASLARSLMILVTTEPDEPRVTQDRRTRLPGLRHRTFGRGRGIYKWSCNSRTCSILASCRSARAARLRTHSTSVGSQGNGIIPKAPIRVVDKCSFQSSE